MTTISSQGTFTSGLWQSIEDIFQKILSCNFVVKLSDGTLSNKSFAHYLSQDVLYLRQDNEALKILSERLDNKRYSEFFQQLANDGIKIEEVMHDDYLSYFKIEEAVKQSPAFSTYGKFILDHAKFSPPQVTAVALLPCFWVYAETGFNIVRNSIKNNQYQKFIDTYAGEEYTDYINQYITIVEELGGKTTSEMRQLMHKAFVEATELELAVFEEAETFVG